MENIGSAYQVAVGQAIAAVRKARKISQSRLALVAKLSTPKFVAIEQGQVKFDLRDIHTIASALNIETAELLQIAQTFQNQAANACATGAQPASAGEQDGVPEEKSDKPQ
jgi:transcriptional regulator with XRE-family HTH domain